MLVGRDTLGLEIHCRQNQEESLIERDSPQEPQSQNPKTTLDLLDHIPVKGNRSTVTEGVDGVGAGDHDLCAVQRRLVRHQLIHRGGQQGLKGSLQLLN